MIIAKLTIEEKLKLLMGKNGWQTEDLNGKIPTVSLSDGPVGVRKTVSTVWDGNTFQEKTLPAVAYPSFETLSQTWDTSLSYQMGECLADDCIELDVDVLLGPGVNIKRSPICGRNFEYFSEDPYVSGLFGKAYIEGLQSGHIGATLKHYVANNNEVGRRWASSNIDERTIREIYFRPFEIALQARPWAVMSCYNLLNGESVAQSKQCTDILRKELGHGNNLLMSDWWAVKDHTLSVQAGTDLEMPYNEAHAKAIVKDFEDGKISEEEIDACLERMLAFIERNEQEKRQRKVRHSVEERRAVAQKIAEEGIVLLKNNGVLPIRDGQSVAFSAVNELNYYAGGGSSRVLPERDMPRFADCLRAVLPSSQVDGLGLKWESVYAKVYENIADKDVSVIMVGFETEEGRDRSTLRLTTAWHNEECFIKAAARRNKNTVVVIFGGGVVDVSAWIEDVAAVVYVGYAGEMGGEAIANILTGKVNPSGKLTETFANHQEDYPSENIFFDGLNYNYDEGMEVGYRYFDKHPEKVQFPFGYGLSYTKFAYSDMAIEREDKGYSVSFTLTNVGEMDGAEISQVYVRAKDSKVEKPLQELRGFSKIFLKKGEKKRVSVLLDDRAFSHYDVESKRWVDDKGFYEIAVAEHAQAPRLFKNIVIG